MPCWNRGSSFNQTFKGVKHCEVLVKHSVITLQSHFSKFLDGPSILSKVIIFSDVLNRLISQSSYMLIESHRMIFCSVVSYHVINGKVTSAQRSVEVFLNNFFPVKCFQPSCPIVRHIQLHSLTSDLSHRRMKTMDPERDSAETDGAETFCRAFMFSRSNSFSSIRNTSLLATFPLIRGRSSEWEKLCGVFHCQSALLYSSRRLLY